MTEMTVTDPHRVAPLHDVEDEDKLAALVASMRRAGWTGAPVVVINEDGFDPQAVTGSHRIAAAREVGLDVPTVDLAELLAGVGVTLADLIAEFEAAGLDSEDATLEVVRRLGEHLPAEVTAHYGLDAH